MAIYEVEKEACPQQLGTGFLNKYLYYFLPPLRPIS